MKWLWSQNPASVAMSATVAVVFSNDSSPVKAESQGVFCRSFAEGLPEQSAEMRHGEAGEFCEFIKGCSHSIVLDDAVECGLEAGMVTVSAESGLFVHSESRKWRVKSDENLPLTAAELCAIIQPTHAPDL